MKLLSYRPMYYNEIDYVTSNCYVATCINDDDCKFQGASHHPLYPCLSVYPCECKCSYYVYSTLYVKVSREKLFIISAVI